MIKLCAICGKRYETNYPKSVLCGKECRITYRILSEALSHAKRAGRLFRRCPRCFLIFKTDNGSNRLCRPCAHELKRQKRIKLCAICGQSFETKRFAIPGSRRLTCLSKKCGRTIDYFRELVRRDGHRFRKCPRCRRRFVSGIGGHGPLCKVCSREFKPVYAKQYHCWERIQPGHETNRNIRRREITLELRDSYIRQLLAEGCNLSASAFPAELIALKREEIKLQRLIKERTP